ncbi:hypothetical protein [Pseudochryseolinea flava]|uniref:Uncharacterized protein n=1 Tax=Pseudochryseolinea flava TaxID=2059302 RepID=A0A364XZR6_9BACT|nr:hypothetical protein [Pseudochryseolinea flava]RAV99874.1 hypothetical protein DQQ10_17695 [Pseudochryseolinea flava]
MMKKVLLQLWMMFAITQVTAQEILADTTFINDAAASARKVLIKSKSRQSHLFNGVAYIEPNTTSVNQFPQYQSNEWTSGWVHYDGERFEGVGVLYDIFTDDVVVEMPSTGASVKLIKEKVSAFHIYDITFKNLSAPAPTPGFYGLVYAGPTPVYVRFEKNKQEHIESGSLSIDYEIKTRYYLVKNGAFHIIKTKGDIFNVLSDKKADLKQFMRQEKLKFKKNKQLSIVKLATFYDTIQH